MEYFDIGKLSKFEHLRELRINLDDESVSYSSFSFSGGLNALGDLKHLRILVSSERATYDLIFCGGGHSNTCVVHMRDQRFS